MRIREYDDCPTKPSTLLMDQCENEVWKEADYDNGRYRYVTQ